VTVIKMIGEEPFNGLVSINNLKSVASLALHTAASEVSAMLRHSGVRHVVVGGVAVCCNGYSRTTSNVDYAVGTGAFEHRNKALYLRTDLPVKYLGIPVHYVAPTNPFEQAMLEQYLVIPDWGQVPILPIKPLIVMKLISRRHKDLADLVELLKRRISEIEDIRAFVGESLPAQKDMFDELVACAEAEMAEGGTIA
jgi:hypothetical protein